jgi:1-aminocyclopropane-1-carboxylate deaminase
MIVPSPLQKLPESLSNPFGVNLWIKRDDLIHEIISGNKFRKLLHNFNHYNEQSFDRIITFGGAHSNHIEATAYLCQKQKITSVGIIRGEQPDLYSPTLLCAKKMGMQLLFISRTEYRNKDTFEFLSDLQLRYPNAYIIPEGGANEKGVKGCEDIVTECQNEIDFDFITVDCGTGATLTGMVRPLQPHQKAIGVQVLKGPDFISKEVQKFNSNTNLSFDIWTDYHFGGYAKFDESLIAFMRWFYNETNIKLDPIYTAKQFFAVFDQLKKGYFPSGSNIILTHTGGLQGIEGFEKRYGLKIY